MVLFLLLNALGDTLDADIDHSLYYCSENVDYYYIDLVSMKGDLLDKNDYRVDDTEEVELFVAENVLLVLNVLVDTRADMSGNQYWAK